MKLPESPFAPRISPYAKEAEREVRGYLRRHGLLNSAVVADYYDSSRLGYLTAQIYPDAVRFRLTLIARWYGVWTVFDDQIERLADVCSAAGVDYVAEAMMSWLGSGDRGCETVETPFGRGFAEVWADIVAESPRPWQDRFLIHLRQYLAGCRWEAVNRRNATVPDLRSYVVSRRRCGGIRVAMDLSEFGGGYWLAPCVYSHPAVQGMLDVVGDITLWSNDLFSADVDQEEGNPSNLLFVVRKWYGRTRQEAQRVILAMLDQRLRRLLTHEGELRSWCAARGALAVSHHDDVERFIEGIHSWISGNVAWSTHNPRYRTAKPRSDGQPNLLLALVPPDFQ